MLMNFLPKINCPTLAYEPSTTGTTSRNYPVKWNRSDSSRSPTAGITGAGTTGTTSRNYPEKWYKRDSSRSPTVPVMPAGTSSQNYRNYWPELPGEVPEQEGQQQKSNS